MQAEKAKQQAILDTERKKSEEEAKKQADIIAKQKAENDKIQAELKAKKDAEIAEQKELNPRLKKH